MPDSWSGSRCSESIVEAFPELLLTNRGDAGVAAEGGGFVNSEEGKCLCGVIKNRVLEGLVVAHPRALAAPTLRVADGVGVLVGVLSALFDAGANPGAGFDGSGAVAEVGGLEDSARDRGERVGELAGGVQWLFGLDFRDDEQAAVFGAGLYPPQGDLGEGAVRVSATDRRRGRRRTKHVGGYGRAGARSVSCQGSGWNFGRLSSTAVAGKPPATASFSRSV